MTKKDLYITLQNIDKTLTQGIHNIINDMRLETINLNVNSINECASCKIIQIRIGDNSKKACSLTKIFVDEYKELNKRLQELSFKYMKATNSFIEFEYGNYT